MAQLFKQGSKVWLKRPKSDEDTKTVGVVRGRPRAASKTTYVVWPDGWAGHVHLTELEIVE